MLLRLTNNIVKDYRNPIDREMRNDMYEILYRPNPDEVKKCVEIGRNIARRVKKL